MTQSTMPDPARKLNLPHGNAATDAIDMDEILSVYVTPRPGSGWRILLVLKAGGNRLVEYSEENIACLKTLGFKPYYPIGRSEP